MMVKNLAIAVLMIFSLLLLVGCTAGQQAKIPETPSPPVIPGETPVDDVAAGISGINNEEDELNASALEDLDRTLADIENI